MSVFRVPALYSWNGPGSPGQNTWHVRTANDDAIGSQADLSAALGALETFYLGVAGGLGYGCKITLGERIVDVTDHLNPRFREIGNKVIDAGASSSNLPPSNMVCVGWQTELAKREGRGRTFIGPLNGATDDETQGIPTTSFINQVRAAATQLVDASTLATGWSVGVLSKRDTSLQVFRDIVGSTTRQQYAVLRSRRD